MGPALEQYPVQRPRPEQGDMQGASQGLEDLKAPSVADEEAGVKRLIKAKEIGMDKWLSAKGALTQD